MLHFGIMCHQKDFIKRVYPSHEILKEFCYVLATSSTTTFTIRLLFLGELPPNVFALPEPDPQRRYRVLVVCALCIIIVGTSSSSSGAAAALKMHLANKQLANKRHRIRVSGRASNLHISRTWVGGRVLQCRFHYLLAATNSTTFSTG